jgi:hypothetical protein
MGEILDKQEIESLAEVAINLFAHAILPHSVPEMVGWKVSGSVIWVFTERYYRQDN